MVGRMYQHFCAFTHIGFWLKLLDPVTIFVATCIAKCNGFHTPHLQVLTWMWNKDRQPHLLRGIHVACKVHGVFHALSASKNYGQVHDVAYMFALLPQL